MPGNKISLAGASIDNLHENRKQLFAERNFTVDASFALDDAKHHPLAVNVADLEAAQLRAAQPSRVKRHKDGAVVTDCGCGNQLRHFSRTENHRKAIPLLRIRKILFPCVSPLEDLDVEEAKCADVQNNGVHRELTFLQKVRVVTPDDRPRQVPRMALC